MWYVYILSSEKNKFIYVGSTSDLKRRLVEHNKGLSVSTKDYRPLKVAAYIAVSEEERARDLEKYFKMGSGKAVLRKRILGNEALA